MSKAFLVEGDEWDFCKEKGISCMFAINGKEACETCRNAMVIERERKEQANEKNSWKK